MAFNGTGSNVTSLNASNLASGTVPTARLGSGTANSTTFLRGDSTYATVSGATGLNMQMFTSSGTFNVPAGITKVKVTVIGASGNSGSGRFDSYWGGASGGGGGAGGYVLDYVSVTPGGTATVTVGTAAGSRTSSFAGSTTLTASGGSNGSNAGGTVPDPVPGNRGASAAASVFGITYTESGFMREEDTVYAPFAGSSNGATISLNTLGSLTSGSVYGHGYGTAGASRTNSPGTATNRHIPIGFGAGPGGGGAFSGGTASVAGSNGVVIVEW